MKPFAFIASFVFMVLAGCSPHSALVVTNATTQPVTVKQTTSTFSVDAEHQHIIDGGNAKGFVQGVRNVEGNTTNISINFDTGMITTTLAGLVVVIALALIVHAYRTKQTCGSLVP